MVTQPQLWKAVNAVGDLAVHGTSGYGPPQYISQLPILCIQPLYGGQPLSHAGPIVFEGCTGYNVQYRVMTLHLCFPTDPSALKRESKTNTDFSHKKPKLQ